MASMMHKKPRPWKPARLPHKPHVAVLVYTWALKGLLYDSLGQGVCWSFEVPRSSKFGMSVGSIYHRSLSNQLLPLILGRAAGSFLTFQLGLQSSSFGLGSVLTKCHGTALLSQRWPKSFHPVAARTTRLARFPSACLRLPASSSKQKAPVQVSQGLYS